MIISISFLVTPEERKHITARRGRFMLFKSRRGTSGSRTEKKSFSAQEFVEYVKQRDPYITLEDGAKMRVYRGGNSTDIVIETICIVETHDEKFNIRAKETTKPIVPEYPDYSDYGW